MTAKKSNNVTKLIDRLSKKHMEKIIKLLEKKIDTKYSFKDGFLEYEFLYNEEIQAEVQYKERVFRKRKIAIRSRIKKYKEIIKNRSNAEELEICKKYYEVIVREVKIFKNAQGRRYNKLVSVLSMVEHLEELKLLISSTTKYEFVKISTKELKLNAKEIKLLALIKNNFGMIDLEKYCITLEIKEQMIRKMIKKMTVLNIIEHLTTNKKFKNKVKVRYNKFKYDYYSDGFSYLKYKFFENLEPVDVLVMSYLYYKKYDNYGTVILDELEVSNETMATHLRMSKSTIEKSIKRLEEKGTIEFFKTGMSKRIINIKKGGF